MTIKSGSEHLRARRIPTKSKMFNGTMLTTVAAIAVSMIGPASAAAQERTVSNAANSAHVNVVQDIVVTATKRDEKLHDVPVAVTALTGAQVDRERIQAVQDVALKVPGVRFSAAKGSITQVIIRGQSQFDDSPAKEVPVGVFIDDVYYGTLASFDADFFDVEQIAILRGPQGTTFGRNVVGGAVQVTSRRPTMGDFNAEVAGTLISRPGFESRGFVNIPLGETLASRFAFSVHDVDGFTDNRITGAKLGDNKSFNTRLSLRYQPSANLDVNANFSYFHRDNFGNGGRLLGEGSLAATLNAQYPKYTDVYQDSNGWDKRDAYVGTLNIQYDTTLGTLTSATGYRTFKQKYSEDIDSNPNRVLSPINNNSDEWAFNQELRLASPAKQRIEYVLGVYYGFESLYKEITQGLRGGSNPQAYLSVMTRGQDQLQTAEQRANVLTAAPFGELKLNVTDELSLTAGARYTYERKRGYTNHIGTSVFYGGPYFAQWEKSWKAFTPRFILAYRPSEDINLYASASKGFKGGGWSITSANAAAAVIPLKPETSWSYELGAKTRWLDGKVNINAAAFLARTKDLQVRTLVNGVFQDSNAGVAEVKGLEIESSFRVSPEFILGVNYAYIDAKYDKFIGCTASGFDCSGNKIPRTPKHDTTVFATYSKDIPALRGALTLRGDIKYSSGIRFSALNDLPGGDYLPAISQTKIKGLLNGSILYEPADQAWDVQFWAKNITKEHSITDFSQYYFFNLTPAEFAAGLRTTGRILRLNPRSFGATLTYRM